MNFSVSDLTEDQRGHLEFILNSPSYADIFVPYLKNLREIQLRLLLRPDDNRKTTFSDDYLRGSIYTIDNLLTFFEKLVEETQTNRMAKSIRDLPGEAQYAALAARGMVGPHRDYAPDQEF